VQKKWLQYECDNVIAKSGNMEGRFGGLGRNILARSVTSVMGQNATCRGGQVLAQSGRLQNATRAIPKIADDRLFLGLIGDGITVS
jgi:hypothetical protein